jgi:putative lipase involved disintegration of autophagic bodies
MEIVSAAWGSISGTCTNWNTLGRLLLSVSHSKTSDVCLTSCQIGSKKAICKQNCSVVEFLHVSEFIISHVSSDLEVFLQLTIG